MYPVHGAGVCEGPHRAANQIRGLLGESGLVVRQGIVNVTKRILAIVEDAGNGLSVLADGVKGCSWT
jgi:hypothetical protein